MRARIVRDWRHPRAEITCPPLRWRAVARRALAATVMTAAGGAIGASAFLFASDATRGWLLPVGVASVAVAVVSVLWLTHLLNAARTPVTFKVANGELWVTRPFLFTRRRRRVRTLDVRDVTVSPAGRLSIRRRFRPALRVRGGARPLAELHRVAEELRTVLGV
jgi:hypothetical protein